MACSGASKAPAYWIQKRSAMRRGHPNTRTSALRKPEAGRALSTLLSSARAADADALRLVASGLGEGSPKGHQPPVTRPALLLRGCSAAHGRPSWGDVRKLGKLQGATCSICARQGRLLAVPAIS